MNDIVNNWTLDRLDQETTIWRYMDFTKFADLVLSRKIYCCRLDSFDDNYEGYISRYDAGSTVANYKSLQQDYKMEIDHLLLANSHLKMQAQLKSTAYANCWHMNEYESAAMWGLYAQTHEAIAIKTTLRKLVCSLSGVKKIRESDQIYLSETTYLDYEKPESYPDDRIGGWLSPLISKRFSFEHEKEVRILYLNLLAAFSDGKSEASVSLDVDISELIDVVYVSPKAPDWFFNMTKVFLVSIGFGGIECQRSDLYNLK